MAAGTTYEPIATTTLGSAASSIDFTSISSAYTDLVVIVNGYYSGTTYGYFRLNGDSGANYSYTRIVGYSGGTLTDRSGVSDALSLGSSASGTWIANIMSYSNTTTYKTIIAREGQPQSGNSIGQYVYLWRSTSAINQITLYGTGGNNFVAGTTATLYGIAAA